MRNFYLLSGNSITKKGTVLKVPTENGIEISFSDITYLDKATLKIDKDKSFEVLKEYNPTLKKDDFLYIIPDMQKKNSISVYYPLFNFKDEKVKYFLDMLEYYLNKRISNIEENNQAGKYDFRNDKSLFNLIRSTLIGITKLDYNEFDSLTDRESIMTGVLKGKLYDSNMKDDSLNPITKKVYEIGSILNNYPSLRNFIYSYVLMLEKENIFLNSKLRTCALYKNNIFKEEDIDINMRQMQLFDFNTDIPKVKEK